MGKSALGSQIALGAATIVEQHPDRFGAILMASYEMSGREVYLRMAAQVADVQDGYHPPRGWSARDLPRAVGAVRRIAALPIQVRDDLPRTVEALRDAVERHAAAHGRPALLVVDHVHLLTAPKTSSLLETLTHVSGALKSLAMQLEVPVLALAQMNRDVARREDHTPVLSDLRASGSLEQDGDVVLFLHRPSYFLEASKRAELEAGGAPTQLIVAKQRMGGTASVAVTWHATRTLFVPDRGWQPRYGAAPLHVPSPIAPPSGGLAERLLDIVRERVATTRTRATRSDLFAALGVAPRQWQDWLIGRAVDHLVADGRLAAAQVGAGQTARYEYSRIHRTSG